jgi:4-hydroxybenzoate polyprenyltransferase
MRMLMCALAGPSSTTPSTLARYATRRLRQSSKPPDASQDRKDDAKAGINSAALLFGDHVKPAITAFAAAFVASLAYVGVATGQGAIYHVLSVGGAAAHLGWQLLILDVDNAESCAICFFVRTCSATQVPTPTLMGCTQSNGNLGYIVTAGIMLQKLYV